MDKSSNSAAVTSGGVIDPVAEHTAFFKDYSASSRRSIQGAWRAVVKACARAGVAPWPLTEVAIEAVVRQWIKRGVSAKALRTYRWALERLQEATAPDTKLTVLSPEQRARSVWSAYPMRRVLRPAVMITVYEAVLLVDRLGKDWESQRLGVLLQLLDATTASLSALLHVKRGDVVENTITLPLPHGQHSLNLNADVVEALIPCLDGVDPQAFLFSNDAGVTPLSARIVSETLRRCAIEILGHPVTWRSVRNASIRFQLRLGIPVRSLATQSGMSVHSLLHAAGLPLSHFEYGMMERYGSPIISEWPLFSHVYQAMSSSRKRFSGARDRAIFSLLYFAFATPETISAMDRDDFLEGMYCLERENGWLAFGCIDRVVVALAEWVTVRGECSGPLFVLQGKQAEVRRMTPAQIESMVRRRSRRQRRCLTASAVRLAGIRRAADAGLPLAELADASDLTYEQLADVLDLHQGLETIARVKLQINALLEARATQGRLEQIRDGLLLRDYVHSGTP